MKFQNVMRSADRHSQKLLNMVNKENIPRLANTSKAVPNTQVFEPSKSANCKISLAVIRQSLQTKQTLNRQHSQVNFELNHLGNIARKLDFQSPQFKSATDTLQPHQHVFQRCR